ncbi:Mov34/MPN/PAD-1 family protein [Marinobacterium lacunae]|uniref:Mov34/MPN/PAD-1 family protein n=1 Tax=Marinobacterium lacunae TaxID=1232683 RepID=UPI00068B1342|nr:Mov34/MPN/PAD-1 family protein [Marinobacterium lacunae]
MILTEATFSVIYNGEERLLVVEPAALRVLLEHRQQNLHQNESGGVLIGERRGKAFIIQRATPPSKKDQAGRFRFVRNGSSHQQLVDEAYRKTDGTSNYIGEWHTHPQTIAAPSYTDYTNWSKALRGMGISVVAVVGNMESWWGLHDAGKFLQFTRVS